MIALIGNTDRHQDNWGIIVHKVTGKVRIAPVFDNGTSRGHEIASNKLLNYIKNETLVKTYIARGKYHMKWAIDDISPAGHLELFLKLAVIYPETQVAMFNCLKAVDYEDIKNILDTLINPTLLLS